MDRIRAGNRRNGGAHLAGRRYAVPGRQSPVQCPQQLRNRRRAHVHLHGRIGAARRIERPALSRRSSHDRRPARRADPFQYFRLRRVRGGFRLQRGDVSHHRHSGHSRTGAPRLQPSPGDGFDRGRRHLGDPHPSVHHLDSLRGVSECLGSPFVHWRYRARPASRRPVHLVDRNRLSGVSALVPGPRKILFGVLRSNCTSVARNLAVRGNHRDHHGGESTPASSPRPKPLAWPLW